MKGILKKKIRIGICIGILVIIYVIRIVIVNADNEKTQIHYLDDSEVAKTANLEISISDEVLYETPAFLSEYSNTEEYFTYFGEIFRSQNNLEDFLDSKYILCAKMKIKNCSNQIQAIDHMGYHISIGDAYHNGIPMDLFNSLNQFSGLSIRAGHEYSFWLVYELNSQSLKKEKYENLLDQDISILVSGYPNIQRIRLNSIRYEAADDKEVEYYKKILGVQDTSEDIPVVQVEDTPKGTMLEIGDTYYEKGVSFTVDSYEITRKIDDVEKMAENTLLENYIDEKGNVICETKYYEDAAVIFITFNVKNLSGKNQSMAVQPGIVNHRAKEKTGGIGVILGDQIQHEENSAIYTIEAGADTTMTYSYIIQESKFVKDKNKWKIDKRPFYLDFSTGANEDADFENGYYSWGKYLRIQ